MRVIPVLDLLGGQVVHAVRGERQRYQPVKSVLCGTADPVSVARAFRDRLGLTEVYVADLDSIQSAGRINHRETVAVLAQREHLSILLDAGVCGICDARSYFELGVSKVVIGSETLGARDAMGEIPAAISPSRLVFSLDLFAGKILSRCSAVEAMQPMEALDQLHAAGWAEVLLLDLQRVGSEAGADIALAACARAAFPELNLLVGGGISNPEQLPQLKGLGAAGVLVATAFHRGIIGAEHIAALQTE